MKLAASIGATFLALAISPASAATVASEGFEGGGFGIFTAAGNVANASGSVYGPCCGTTGSPSALANRFIAFGGGNLPGGTLSTTFGTVANTIYNYSFRVGALGDTSRTDSFSFNFGSTAGGGGSFLADNNLDTTFKTISGTFAAAGPATTFSITGGGADNVDFVFDDFTVSGAVAAVPEPAAWAMMTVGFGMIGYGLRRRKAKLSTTVSYARDFSFLR